MLAPAGMRILSKLEAISEAVPDGLVLTSGSEARGRSATDPHSTGEAVDVSVRGMSPGQMRVIHKYLTNALGSGFTVLLEVPPAYQVPAEIADIIYLSAGATAIHLHIQRKKGTTWP